MFPRPEDIGLFFLGVPVAAYPFKNGLSRNGRHGSLFQFLLPQEERNHSEKKHRMAWQVSFLICTIIAPLETEDKYYYGSFASVFSLKIPDISRHGTKFVFM
jgi:hypothetical protein